jgi:hypothetical protein
MKCRYEGEERKIHKSPKIASPSANINEIGIREIHPLLFQGCIIESLLSNSWLAAPLFTATAAKAASESGFKIVFCKPLPLGLVASQLSLEAMKAAPSPAFYKTYQ